MKSLSLKQIYFLGMLVFIFNVLDVITTQIGLSLGHYELNVFFREGYNFINLPIKLLFITAIIVAFYYIYSKLKTDMEKLPVTCLYIALFLDFVIAFINNILVILS